MVNKNGASGRGAVYFLVRESNLDGDVMELELGKLKKTFAQFVTDGVLDNRVVEALKLGDGFVPIETQLWDYKRQLSGDTDGLAKTVLQVVSLYNTYGGYLLFGFDEDKAQKKVTAVGVKRASIDPKQLSDKVSAYTGQRISIGFAEIPLQSDDMCIGILCVPKRPKSESPLYFGKNGPTENGRHLFEKDQAYIRSQDNCVPALKRSEMQLLFSDRQLDWGEEGLFPIARDEPLFNSLPDRHVICPRFIGRDQVIESLWKWLGDPFAFAKLLAGAGGRGKTSVAYEFAEEICRAKPYSFEKVVWLTAKKHQFIGIRNEYADMPETHFSDVQSLLNALCRELAVLDEEVEGASTNLLKQKIKSHLNLLPAFVIIDDVDTLSHEHQKMVMELALQLGSTSSRFLLTARENFAYSEDLCINVPGLSLPDYRELMSVYTERFGIVVPPKKITELHDASGGSPLLTESILRLVKMGMPVEKAIAEWKGSAGEAAREAVLMREVERLSLEARRVLLTLSYLGEASATEVRRVTGYDNAVFERCLKELTALFLVSTPPIIKAEARFKVDRNTALLVIQNAEKLVTDPRAIEREIKASRQISLAGREGPRRDVGIAINQAIALLRDGRPGDAASTMDAAIKSVGQHPDLLLTKGRCLLKVGPSSLDEARRAFKAAYDVGQRKSMLFDLWWEAEKEANHGSGMVDVAKAALEEEAGPVGEWMLRRAYGFWLLSKGHKGALNSASALRELSQGADDLATAIKMLNGSDKADAIEASKRFHDELCALAGAQGGNQGALESFDVALNAIRRGDVRAAMYLSCVDALERMAKNTRSGAASSVLDGRVRAIETVVEARITEIGETEALETARRRLAHIRKLGAEHTRG